MNYIRFLLLSFPILFCCAGSHADQPEPVWQFENEVQNYVDRSIEHPPVPGCTLFVGSSSFQRWNALEKTFSDYKAVNRGFGGSTFPDNLRAMDRIHLPVQPVRVVIFCGTNDIANGTDVETVFKNFKFYIARIWNEYPFAEIYFVSPTHAPVREQYWKACDKLFDLVKEFSEKVNKLYCIDIRPSMLGNDGRVREDLFVKDRLHLNAEGYKIWERVFKETFDKPIKDQGGTLAQLYANRKAVGLFDDPRFAEEGITIRNDPSANSVESRRESVEGIQISDPARR